MKSTESALEEISKTKSRLLTIEEDPYLVAHALIALGNAGVDPEENCRLALEITAAAKEKNAKVSALSKLQSF